MTELRRALFALEPFALLLFCFLLLTGCGQNNSQSNNNGGSPQPGPTIPTFNQSFSVAGTAYSYTMVGNSPQNGTTTIPTVIIPVSLVFDEYLNGQGQKTVIDATSSVSSVVQSPIFQNYGFTTGTTQYGDAIQRAEFNSAGISNWHTLLGQPQILPAVSVNIPAGHSLLLQSKTNNTQLAMLDISLVDAAIVQKINALEGTSITPGVLPIFVVANAGFYGTSDPNYALNASDPTVCCAWGEHKAFMTSSGNPQSYIVASYLAPGTVPQAADGLAVQGGGPVITAADVQPVSEQVAEWLNDPFYGLQPTVVPSWETTPAPVSCASYNNLSNGIGAGGIEDTFFFEEPTHFLLPQQAASAVMLNGTVYHLQNAALLPWYEQAPTSNAFNGAYSYPDTTALSAPAQTCTDFYYAGAPTPAATPVPMGTPNGHWLIGYWEFPGFSSSGFFSLRNVSPQFDVVIVIGAGTAQGSTSLLQFTPPPEQTVSQFKADIAYLQSQGKKVLVTLGGGGVVLQLNTAADIQNFVTSAASIVQTYGFDGIDMDVENPSLVLDPGDTDFRNPTTPSIMNLIAAVRQLKTQFGSNFMITEVPEPATVQAGYTSYSGMSGSFLPVLYGTSDILTFVDPQDYDTPPLEALDGNYYIPGTADYHVALTEMLLQGFPVAHNPNLVFPALPPEKIAFGVAACACLRDYTSFGGLQDAWNYLTTGTSYGGQYQLQNPAGYQNLNGIMTWSTALDRWNNYAFSNTIGPMLHQMPQIQ